VEQRASAQARIPPTAEGCKDGARRYAFAPYDSFISCGSAKPVADQKEIRLSKQKSGQGADLMRRLWGRIRRAIKASTAKLDPRWDIAQAMDRRFPAGGSVSRHRA
jgi:hypothetical protein